MPARPAPTTLARLTAERPLAQRIIDGLHEVTDPDTTAVSASEAPDGWVVEIHFRDPPDQTTIRELVARIGGAEAATALSFSRIDATDWVQKSLQGLTPVEAGRFVVHGAHDRDRIAPHRIGIEIEAALAFGTGHHGTTRGCLLALDLIARLRKPPRRILDVGTGSGVLAIAAARRLRRKVLASDIDRQAVVVARDNARRNAVAPFIETIHAPGLAAQAFRQGGSFDLVLANILLAPLVLMSASAARLVGPGGHIVLSGLLPAHAPAALSAYRTQGLRLVRRITLEGWTTLVMQRPARHS